MTKLEKNLPVKNTVDAVAMNLNDIWIIIDNLGILILTYKYILLCILQLHQIYKKVCERRNLSALDISEFISLTSLVEARGILRVIGKTHNRLSKVIIQRNAPFINKYLD